MEALGNQFAAGFFRLYNRNSDCSTHLISGWLVQDRRKVPGSAAADIEADANSGTISSVHSFLGNWREIEGSHGGVGLLLVNFPKY